VPLTEWSVESVVKSIDLDTKDILITPGTPAAVHITPLIRAAVLNVLKKMDFGQLLNDLTRVMARDGTVVVKTYVDEIEGEKEICSTIVDLLNLWIDPSAPSMQDGSILERSIKSEADINNYSSVWENIDAIPYTTNIPRIWDVFNVTGTNVIPFTEIWEMWGKVKKSWITEDHEDDDKWVDGHVVAAGIGAPSVILLIRKNPRKDGRKPYEECQYRRVHGRWYGRGVAEMLFGLQEYTNLVVNIRKANNMVLQNGIFLIRKGSGITPDMLSSITAGGGLAVTNINNDIKQLQVQDFRQSSYTDEDRAYMMSDRVTGSFDINRGEAGKASESATATLTQDKHIRDTFVLVQENMGFFIERLITQQYIPLLKETMTEEDFIKVTGDASTLAFIDEHIVTNRVNKFISDKIKGTGFYPEAEKIEEFRSNQDKFLKGMGKQRFIKYFNELFDEDIDIEVHITDEKFNRVVAVQQLRDLLIANAQSPNPSKLDVDAVTREMLNIMGVKGEFYLEKPPLPVYGTPPVNQLGTPRPLKNMPTGLPTEMTANQNAMGIPQMTPLDVRNPAPPMTNTIPAQVRR
jgi:hypothetical protein